MQRPIMKKGILFWLATIIVLSVTCTSCLTTMALLSTPNYSSQSTGNDISKSKTYLNLTILQTLSKYEALAWTKHYDVVKIETLTDIYYDGKTINGYFTLVGTYRYVTKQNVTKTVPIYVLTSEYNKNSDVWR